MHPRSKHWHLIDYIIVRRKDRNDVTITKSMCGADCWTDHRLIVSKMRLHIQPQRRPQGTKTIKKLHTTKLQNQEVAENLKRSLDEKLAELTDEPASIEDHWKRFKDTVYSTAFEHLGPAVKKNQDWFD